MFHTNSLARQCKFIFVFNSLQTNQFLLKAAPSGQTHPAISLAISGPKPTSSWLLNKQRPCSPSNPLPLPFAAHIYSTRRNPLSTKWLGSDNKPKADQPFFGGGSKSVTFRSFHWNQKCVRINISCRSSYPTSLPVEPQGRDDQTEAPRLFLNDGCNHHR